MIALPQQIAEVERELALRKAVYEGLVKRKKMSQDQADTHTERMAAVLKTLKWMHSQNVGEPRMADMLLAMAMLRMGAEDPNIADDVFRGRVPFIVNGVLGEPVPLPAPGVGPARSTPEPVDAIDAAARTLFEQSTPAGDWSRLEAADKEPWLTAAKAVAEATKRER